MDIIQLKTALHSGKLVYGMLVASPSPRWLDAVGSLGLDFIFIDTEHIVLDRMLVSWMCHGYAGIGLPAIVRIPSANPVEAQRAIDGGAHGVIVPYVETADQAKQLRGAIRFRPLKGERLAAALQDENSLDPDLRKYLEMQNSKLLYVINIESVPAVNRLDEILEVPGLDAILIGPHDLSCSLGIPEQYSHPSFESAVQLIIRKAQSYGVGAGVHWQGDPQRIAEWTNCGLNMIIHSSDISSMCDKMSRDLTTLRRVGNNLSGGIASGT